MPFFIIMFLSICSGIMANNGYTILIAVLFGFFVGIPFQMCWSDAKDIVNSKRRKERMNRQIKAQEKYDNEWGIIEYKNNNK